MTEQSLNIFSKVSVVMTSYNYGDYIGQAIDSVFNQIYENWELIIIDDGSTDGSQKIIEKYISQNPHKTIFIKNEKNLGLKASTEIALTKVSGKYTAFLESDDVWTKDHLSKKVSAAEKHKNASLIYSNLDIICDEKVNIDKYTDYLNYCRYAGWIINRRNQKPFRIVFFRNPVVSFSNIFIKSELVNDLILIKEYEIWSDWQLVMQAALKGEFVYLPEKLVYWRVHNESFNNRFMRKINPKSEGARFRVILNTIIKDKISKDNEDVIIEYLYNQYSLKFKLDQFFHEIGFAFYSPKSVYRELKRRLEKKQ